MVFVDFICNRLLVCLPRQYGLPVYCTNTKLDTSCIYGQTGLSRQANTWAPLWKYMHKVFFSKGVTMHCPVQEPNQVVFNLLWLVAALQRLLNINGPVFSNKFSNLSLQSIFCYTIVL